MIRDKGLIVVAVLAFGAVALAVGLQVGFDMRPCAWCVFQRLLYLVIGLLAVLAWLAGRGSASRLLAALALVTSLGGVVTALYQHLVASHSESCVQTLADQVVRGLTLDQNLPMLFQATAFCNEANVPLLGLPFAIWSAVLFGLLALILIGSVKGRRRR